MCGDLDNAAFNKDGDNQMEKEGIIPTIFPKSGGIMHRIGTKLKYVGI